jgi:predicted hydrocarbon binding protein
MYDIRKIQEQVIFNAVKNASNHETAESIVFGCKNEFAQEDNPNWVKNTMSRLENEFDENSVIQIRTNCQCGYGMDEKLEFLNELIRTSSNLDEFANNDRAKAAGLSYSNGEIYLQFPFCPCPMLADVDKLESKTWCQCTTGYSKVLFEKAFNCQVDVELLKSVKMGDSNCLMKIILIDHTWNKHSKEVRE